MQVVNSETGLTAGPIGWAAGISLGSLGYYIIGIFLASWALSILVFKLRHIDQMDDRLLYASTSTGPGSGGE
jgi:high-affinity nickel-transport protein